MLQTLTLLFNVIIILESGIIPNEWLIRVITPIFKNKEDINDPDNYRQKC